MGILCHIEYKSSLRHKAVYNFAMFYLITLIITDLKILEDLENNQTNPWYECNPMTLNKMILNI